MMRSLERYAADIVGVLGESLSGIYVYGSLVRGCYNPAASDVDIVVVTTQAVSQCNDLAILDLHNKFGAAIDAAFVTNEQADADEFPATVDFLVKPVSGCKIVRPSGGSRDFLLQRQDVYEAGVALSGQPPNMRFHPVPWALLSASLDYLFPNIVPYFKNPVLMMCRVAYAYERRLLCGKRDAGIWAADVFDDHWKPMIRAALDEYANGVTQTHISKAALAAFEDYCAKYIGTRRADA